MSDELKHDKLSKKEEELEEMVRAINELPKFKKLSVCWLIHNIKIAEELSGGPMISDEKLEGYIRKAEENGDHVLYALVMYKHSKDVLNRRRKESDNTDGGDDLQK